MELHIAYGPTPVSEECQQLGPGYDEQMARKECVAFIGQIRRQFGKEPAGARLAIKSNPHDYGNYLDVVCYYEGQTASRYANKIELHIPEEWDSEAQAELGHALSNR